MKILHEGVIKKKEREFMFRYNHEGYHDPTVYEALTNVMKEEKKEGETTLRPLVYICSPYSGAVDRNVRNARKFCRFTLMRNYIPIAPHLFFPQFMEDNNPKERELAMLMNMVLLGKCNELWVFGSIISKGMAQEIAKAKKRKQLIRYFNDKLQEVFK